MVLVYSRAVWPPHRYTRLFLCTGVLGGFTTFSATSEQGRSLLADGDTLLAGGYLFGTLAACLVAVAVAGRVAR